MEYSATLSLCDICTKKECKYNKRRYKGDVCMIINLKDQLITKAMKIFEWMYIQAGYEYENIRLKKENN